MSAPSKVERYWVSRYYDEPHKDDEIDTPVVLASDHDRLVGELRAQLEQASRQSSKNYGGLVSSQFFLGNADEQIRNLTQQLEQAQADKAKQFADMTAVEGHLQKRIQQLEQQVKELEGT